VTITDIDQSRLDATLGRITTALDARVAKGGLTAEVRDEVLARIHTTLTVDDFAACDLVIEAVFEDLAVKKDVLNRLDGIVQPDAILASNTSSLSIDAMASFIADPSRMAGIHFFNPVSVMKLVEVVRAPRMSDESLATAIDVARQLGKTPVIVADEAGFVVNRLLSVFLGEALRLVERGVSTSAISEALRPLRLPMSPFTLIDLIGRTVTMKMLQSLETFAPARFFVGESLVELTAKPISDTIAKDLAARHEATLDMPLNEIHDTIVDALAREVHIMLTSGVVASAREIDLCMMNGAGWPAAIGGMTPYLDGCGASERSNGVHFHADIDFA
jgi:3-hydroxyacyl-CoA dehydrogenase